MQNPVACNLILLHFIFNIPKYHSCSSFFFIVYVVVVGRQIKGYLLVLLVFTLKTNSSYKIRTEVLMTRTRSEPELVAEALKHPWTLSTPCHEKSNSVCLTL